MFYLLLFVFVWLDLKYLPIVASVAHVNGIKSLVNLVVSNIRFRPFTSFAPTIQSKIISPRYANKNVNTGENTNNAIKPLISDTTPTVCGLPRS